MTTKDTASKKFKRGDFITANIEHGAITTVRITDKDGKTYTFTASHFLDPEEKILSDSELK